jgi:hypothetical protein
MTYFEDWLFTSDAEIGPYNYFGMTCNIRLKCKRSYNA